MQIVPPGTQIDFVGKWRICLAISVALLLISAAAIPWRGFRLGIDFAGGTEVQVRFPDDSAIDEGTIRSAVTDLGISEPSVVRFGSLGVNEFLIRFRGGLEGTNAAWLDPLRDTLAEAGGSVSIERVEFVGPRVGAELRRDGLYALGIACLLILVYIAFRFSARFAPGAVVALVHDVSITSGIWILLGNEFDLRVLAALLAIVGYSLNDTIIVYDRIRENMELRTKHDLPEVLNRSVNQTLSRTILTSRRHGNRDPGGDLFVGLHCRADPAAAGKLGRATGWPLGPNEGRKGLTRGCFHRSECAWERDPGLRACGGAGLGQGRLRRRAGRCLAGRSLPHLDGPVEYGPLLHDQAGSANVPLHRTAGLDLDPLRGAHVASDATDHDDALGFYVRRHVAVGADRELVFGQLDLALDPALDHEVLVAREIALDRDRFSDVGHFPSLAVGFVGSSCEGATRRRILTARGGP
jgi:preprotein translocase SecF subunit